MQKTYDRQTAKFLAVMAENIPEISGERMQGWIENPKALQIALRGALCPSAKETPAAADHVIDLNADPFVPKGCTVEEHQKGGQFKWDATKMTLYLSKEQQDGKWIKGNKLREELRAHNPCNYSAFNANLLDYLLKHQHLIPEDWKGKYVFFWGTVYRRPDGTPCVRCLYCGGRVWLWDVDWLGGGWSDSGPAAVPAR
jgi:hypothetical protein